jgi:adenosine deaminase
VDLHRHLEGSLRPATLLEIARQHGIPLPSGDFMALVQMQPGEPLNFTTFLSKFQTLRQFYRSPEVIERITREAVEDAAADGVRYLELRFTPAALGRLQGFSLARVMDWVVRAAEDAARACDLPVQLIASVNRHEPVELAEEVARLAAERLAPDHRVGGIVGLDLAGSEANFSALPFEGVFREARESGLRVTVHAGEWGGPENIREALERLGAERIGHGARVLEDPMVAALVRERGAALEVCLTSNYQSGVVASLEAHPLPRMLAAGLPATINTDDPSISSISLSDEYRQVVEGLGLDLHVLGECILRAARASFLSPEGAAALEADLRRRLQAGPLLQSPAAAGRGVDRHGLPPVEEAL